MAIIRNAANTIMRGRVGETTYYVSLGRQVARQRLNNSNYGKDARRTEAQQVRRVKWANLINFYRASKKWMPRAYETTKKGQTDYNRFMQINIPTSTISLTKQLASSGACVVEPYLISQGSIPSIGVEKFSDGWITNLMLGNLETTDNMSVKDFSLALVNNNKQVRLGMQLSFVSYMQTVDTIGVPRITCTLYEVTLSDTNTAMLSDYLPAFCRSVNDGYLGTSNAIVTGAFAYILSSNDNGRIQVSTQRLINNNTELITNYSSKQSATKSIDSYGIDTEYVLSPLSTVMQDAVSAQLSILYVVYNGVNYNSGDYLGSGSELSGKNVDIIMSEDIGTDMFGDVEVETYDKKGNTATITSAGAKTLSIKMPTMTSTRDIQYIQVELNSGRYLTIYFSEDNQGEDLGE